MRNAFCGWLSFWLAAGIFPPSALAFSSLYVFGDGLSSTTNSPGAPQYFGNRFSNGRVWVEVLAQRQGINYESNKNWSFFGHFSANLITNLNQFVPTNAATALGIVWVNNADFVDFLTTSAFEPYATNNLAIWTNAIQQSVSNHRQAVQILYAKGLRTLILPNAVDLTKAPYFTLMPAEEAFIRQRVSEFNLTFTNRLRQLQTTLPGLNLVVPDMFATLDDLIARPGVYGLTNVTGDAIDDLFTPTFTGPGTNYLFWDYLHPTAKVHVVLADKVHQLLAPTRIAAISTDAANAQLVVVNTPVGLGGVVEGSTNLLNWSTVQTFASTNATQTIAAPAAGDRRFYRLRFPFAWTWP